MAHPWRMNKNDRDPNARNPAARIPHGKVDIASVFNNAQYKAEGIH